MLALIFISLLVVMIGIFPLTITHTIPFLDITFEVVSAFATVGLSRNTTGQLNDFDELLIMAIMFIGRIGPLALGFVLSTASPGLLRYPRGRVFIG